MGGSGSGRRTVSSVLAGLALVVCWNCVSQVWAVNRDYILEPTQSNIALSGTVATSLGTSPILSQGNGTQGGNSLTTRYNGTIKTVRDTNSIQVVAGSVVDANSNGSWQPLDGGASGSAAADYGGKATFLVIFTANFAGRNFVGSLTSDVATIDGSNHFPLTSTTLEFTSGNIAYRQSATVLGDQSIAGESGTLTGNGTVGLLSQGGLVYETVTIPANSTFHIVDPNDPTTVIDLTLTGQLFGKALIPASNGDYNQNGVVDGADYVVWRSTSGQTGVGLAADGNGDGQVTNADFTLWRSKFGQSAGVGAGDGLSMEGAVPEPGCAMLLVAAAAAGVLGRGRLRSTV